MDEEKRTNEEKKATEPFTPAHRRTPASPLEERVVEALKSVYDPEIPVNIFELGLVYDVSIGPEGEVGILMTLTSPACPVAGSLPGDVEQRVRTVEGVGDPVRVEVTWEPAWSPEMMTEAAKLQLGMV